MSHVNVYIEPVSNVATPALVAVRPQHETSTTDPLPRHGVGKGVAR